MEKQTFFYGNTHFSNTHILHDNKPLATEWSLGVEADRPSGFKQVKSLGHTDFVGQSTLDMFSPVGKMHL